MCIDYAYLSTFDYETLTPGAYEALVARCLAELWVMSEYQSVIPLQAATKNVIPLAAATKNVIPLGAGYSNVIA